MKELIDTIFEVAFFPCLFEFAIRNKMRLRRWHMQKPLLFAYFWIFTIVSAFAFHGLSQDTLLAFGSPFVFHMLIIFLISAVGRPAFCTLPNAYLKASDPNIYSNNIFPVRHMPPMTNRSACEHVLKYLLERKNLELPVGCDGYQCLPRDLLRSVRKHVLQNNIFRREGVILRQTLYELEGHGLIRSTLIKLRHAEGRYMLRVSLTVYGRQVISDIQRPKEIERALKSVELPPLPGFGEYRFSDHFGQPAGASK